MNQTQSSTQHSIKADGKWLVDEVKRAVHAGAARRIVIKQDGRSVVELPLLAGMAGAVLAPPLAAIGALTALLTNCTIGVEHEATATDSTTSNAPAVEGSSTVPESPPPADTADRGDGAVMTVTAAGVEAMPASIEATAPPAPVQAGPVLVFDKDTATPDAVIA